MLEGIAQHPAKIPPEEIARLVGRPDPLIVEMGAHEGDDTERFVKAMPKAIIYCFEPYPAPAERFRQRMQDYPNVELIEAAVGDRDGPVPFHPSTGKGGGRDDWDLSGSLQRPTGHLARSPEIQFKDPINVQCIRLDTWTSRTRIGPPLDFIWADVQGGQRGLIAGGRLALAVTRWLYIECHTEPLYDQEPTQEELVALLPGFERTAIFEQDNILFKNRHFP
jgi:FkbM family methyltransferase